MLIDVVADHGGLKYPGISQKSNRQQCLWIID